MVGTYNLLSWRANVGDVSDIFAGLLRYLRVERNESLKAFVKRHITYERIQPCNKL